MHSNRLRSSLPLLCGSSVASSCRARTNGLPGGDGIPGAQQHAVGESQPLTSLEQGEIGETRFHAI
ncbi:hypothetical protein BDW22DRAFT_1360461 [Trametopsis cervina]|nr:hypothetical protein BDW22DRAFT_1360461 [Trametopsis cervina]